MRAEKIFADAVAIDGRKEWICKFCSKANVWTRRRCRGCHTNIPSGLPRKHRQAVSATAEGYSPGSSSSSGGSERQRQIRELCEELKRCKNAEKGQETQCETALGKSGLDEEWKMDIDEGVDSKKLGHRKKELQRQLRGIERFTDFPKETQDALKEKWQQEM